MPDLSPITALGGTIPRQDSFGALTLTENNALALASLALRHGQPAPTPFGLSLPEPGHVTTGDGFAALWVGPEQWLIAAQGRADEDFARDLTAAAPGCSVTAQTDGWVAIEIRSDAGETPITALLEKLANLDPVRFGPSTGTRTLLHHMGVFLIRSEGDRLTVLGMRSAAETLWHALSRDAQRLAKVT